MKRFEVTIHTDRLENYTYSIEAKNMLSAEDVAIKRFRSVMAHYGFDNVHITYLETSGTI